VFRFELRLSLELACLVLAIVALLVWAPARQAPARVEPAPSPSPSPTPSPSPSPTSAALPPLSSIPPDWSPPADLPEPSEPGTGACIPREECCRVCQAGQACGKGCISDKLTCHKGRGCACNAWEICPAGGLRSSR
jgi:hypothetical protein